MKKSYIVPVIEVELANWDADCMFGPNSGDTKVDSGINEEVNPGGDKPGINENEGDGTNIGAKKNGIFFNSEW